MYLALLGQALDRSKLMILIIFDVFWMCAVHGNMLRRIAPDSQFKKRPGDWDVTMCGCHVGPDIPNVGFLEVYERLWGYMKVCEGLLKYM